jgi:glycosyltransferase involved in cell wall biosynthesis
MLRAFTVVMPIHNEEELLPYSLSSVYSIKPREVLVALDRCTDKSAEILGRYAENYPGTDTHLIEFNEPCDYRFRPAYLRRSLYELSSNDVILNTSADLVLDPTILRSMDLGKNGLISFGYYDYPFNYQGFAKRVISVFAHGFAGLLALSRRAWRETEDLEDLKLQPRAEDTHLILAISRKYPTRYINTKTLHLRGNEAKLDHYRRGEAQWMVQRKSVFMAFAHSLVMLRPSSFTGYIRARGGSS